VGGAYALGRRSLTEVRDRLAPAAARLRGERDEPPMSFPTFTA
jgi:hypothetical protein